MDLGIRGRKALVNGGSAGMGKAAAFALAHEGVDLVISARKAARLQATAQEIAAATGVTVVPVVADHSTAEGRARILAVCPDPDILIATCSPPPMTEDYRSIDAAQWEASLDTGLLSPVHFMTAVLDGMVERRWGRIVNITSVVGISGNKGQANYTASKAGLIGFTKSVSKELASRNVLVNAVAPGFIDTELTRKISGEAREALIRAIPMGRLGQGSDVASAVLFLASDFASYITGQVLVVDGGMVL